MLAVCLSVGEWVGTTEAEGFGCIWVAFPGLPSRLLPFSKNGWCCVTTTIGMKKGSVAAFSLPRALTMALILWVYFFPRAKCYSYAQIILVTQTLQSVKHADEYHNYISVHNSHYAFACSLFDSIMDVIHYACICFLLKTLRDWVVGSSDNDLCPIGHHNYLVRRELALSDDVRQKLECLKSSLRASSLPCMFHTL